MKYTKNDDTIILNALSSTRKRNPEFYEALAKKLNRTPKSVRDRCTFLRKKVKSLVESDKQLALPEVSVNIKNGAFEAARFILENNDFSKNQNNLLINILLDKP